MSVTKTIALHFRKSLRKTACAQFSNSAIDEKILKSRHEHVDIPEINIPDYIFSKCSKWDNLIATECAETGRKYTFKEFRKYSKNLAGHLRKKLKLNKGDVVGLLLPNSPEYALAAVGILHGGLIVTTFNPMYTPDEISKQLNDSDTKVIITQTALWPLAKAAVSLTKKSIQIITTNTKTDQTTPEGAINLQEFFRNDIDTSDIKQASPEDIACLPYSSGTTGLPKGVELRHSNIVSNLWQLKPPGTDYILEATDDHQDVLPAVLPQFHIYGLTNLTFLTLAKGCRTIHFPKFDPVSYIKTLAVRQPDILLVAPPLVLFMSSHDAVKPQYLSSIRVIVSGAAPLGESDEDKFINKFFRKRTGEFHVIQGYGLTESSPAIALGTRFEKPPGGSIGPLLANTEVKIVASDGSNDNGLGPNERGEILLRGPQVMKGYHNKPKETEEVFSNGWLRTGDIGFYDEKGNLTVTDRLKELIKVKGYQVPPAEIEAVVRDHPDVLEAAVVGIPHERFGEVPRAYVVLKPGAQFDETKIQEFMKDKVASYKQLLGGIKCVESIPKNAAGKILRRRISDKK